jgi:antitoxin component of RelBE/YafQ-DinJ toxin-antitoxin module
MGCSVNPFLSVSNAIRLLIGVAADKALPLEIKVPNAERAQL